MRNARRKTIIALFAAAMQLAWRLPAPAAPPSQEDLARAIEHLGDSNPAVRTDASKVLREAGKDAEPLLRQSVRSDNPEVAAEARHLLRLLSAKSESVPDTDPPVLAQYRNANEGLRRRIVLEQVGRQSTATLARLWAIERDAELRALIFQKLQLAPSPAAASFLADGNVTTAALLLDVAMDNHSEEAVVPYTLLRRYRGALDDAILRWTIRAARDPADAWPQRVLAALYRAKGQWPAATEAARRSQVQEVLEDTLLASADFKRLGAALRARPVPVAQMREMTLLLACDQLTGDAAGFEDDLKKAKAAIASPQDATILSNTLLMCSRPDEATRLLIDQEQWLAAVEIMVARGQYDEALALAGAHDADSSENALLLRAAAARLLDRLGQRDAAQQMRLRIAAENKIAASGPVSLELGLARREAGDEEGAWDDFADAVTRISGDFALAIPISRIFESPIQDIDYFGLWRLLQQSNAAGAERQNFKTMRAVFERSMPVGQVRDLGRWNGHGPVNAPVMGQLMWESARRMADSGQMDEARALLESQAHRFETPDLLLRVGDLAAQREEWDGAAQWYNVSWETDRLQALPLYLRAMALAKAGDRADSAETMHLAALISMGNEHARFAVMRELEQRGMRDGVSMEARALLETGPAVGVGCDNAARIAAQAAAERHDWADVIPLLQRRIAALSEGKFWFRDRVGFLSIALHLHRAAAGVALAAGDMPTMRREVEAFDSLDPIEIEFPLELVQELDARGRRAEGDALFAHAWELQEKLCRKYPESAFEHNQAAWLAAECNRELDHALEHATRAVALEPKRAAYLDTLAEVHFRQGHIDQAIAEMKQCLKMQPRNRQHQEHLEKFEAAKR